MCSNLAFERVENGAARVLTVLGGGGGVIARRTRNEPAKELHDSDDSLDVPVLFHVSPEGGGEVREDGHLQGGRWVVQA